MSASQSHNTFGSDNTIQDEGGKAIAGALSHWQSITSLDLRCGYVYFNFIHPAYLRDRPIRFCPWHEGTGSPHYYMWVVCAHTSQCLLASGRVGERSPGRVSVRVQQSCAHTPAVRPKQNIESRITLSLGCNVSKHFLPGIRSMAYLISKTFRSPNRF